MNTERKLAAIVAADMVGYSRLMERDEAGTLARLKAYRLELIDPCLEKHHGRLVKTTGDGLLVCFDSVMDALECAVEVQTRIARRNRDVDPGERIEFRTGINLGDVIIEDDDVFGDGVNLAARLERLAPPGGICVTGIVRDQTDGRIDADFEDLGEQQVKNIQRPVRVFRVALPEAPGEAGAPVIDSTRGTDRVQRPSIAVLPLINMSGDAEQNFFADGLTEDIVTALSRFHQLFVISRNSSFAFKGKSVNTRDVARELGVRYVVEGSVRKAGRRVRVTVQLIDADRDMHVWADRYDRDLEDIFAIQDELTAAIVATVSGRVEAATEKTLGRKPTDNMAAYECVLNGKLLHHRSTPEDNLRAQQLLDKSIELDPDYAHAHAWKACVLGQAWINGWCEDGEAAWKGIVRETRRALDLDDADSDVHRIMASICLINADFDRARYHQQRGLALNPNNDLLVVQQGEFLTWNGEPEEGIDWIRQAIRLNPYHPERFWSHLGRAYFVARRYEEAVEAFKRLTEPNVDQHSLMAAAYAYLDDEAAAKRHADAVLSAAPDFSTERHLGLTTRYRHEGDRQHHAEGLLRAGLPE